MQADAALPRLSAFLNSCPINPSLFLLCDRSWPAEQSTPHGLTRCHTLDAALPRRNCGQVVQMRCLQLRMRSTWAFEALEAPRTAPQTLALHAAPLLTSCCHAGTTDRSCLQMRCLRLRMRSTCCAHLMLRMRGLRPLGTLAPVAALGRLVSAWEWVGEYAHA